MAKAGGKPGNQNAVKNPWRTALESVVSKSPLKLRQVAETLIDAAIAGDIQAIKELGDRLDGKPRQAVEVAGEDGNAISLTVVFRDAIKDAARDND